MRRKYGVKGLKSLILRNKITAMIKISSDTSGRIKVTFPYSAEAIAKIKTVKTHRWHPDGKTGTPGT